MKLSYSLLIVIFIALSLFGNYYKKYIQIEEINTDEKLIHEFLLHDVNEREANPDIDNNKPILWIHTEHEINARKWINFGSRNTTDLNQPYLYLTIKSILKHSHHDFNVCMIEDSSFSKLINGWNIELDKIPEPVRGYIRSLALYKVLYIYGGFLVPPSYLSLSSMKELYDTYIQETGCFVGASISRTLVSERTNVFVNPRMIGTTKNHPVIKELIQEKEYLISRDYTHEQLIDGSFDRLLYKKVKQGKMKMIEPRKLGVLTEKHKPVYIDHLLGTSYIDFVDPLYGIYIPSDEILRRIKFQWFARMSVQQIYQSPIILCKYIQSNELLERT